MTTDVIADANLYVDHKFHFGPGGLSVLKAFMGGDFTDQEVAANLGMKHKTVSARRTELWRWGLVIPVGLRHMVRQRAKVWQITTRGLQQAKAGITRDPR
jgi:hypothetical protein